MKNRKLLKWLHWLAFGLILYFFAVEPDESRTDPGGALSTHAGVGVLLLLVVAIWLFHYLKQGMAGRAGPKLPNWGKRVWPIMHKALYWGMPIMLLTGGLSAFAAPYLIKGFGFIPLNWAGGGKAIHDRITDIHEFVFDALIVLIVAHALFHIWRHFRLKDNALRIIMPKFLHKYL